MPLIWKFSIKLWKYTSFQMSDSSAFYWYENLNIKRFNNLISF